MEEEIGRLNQILCSLEDDKEQLTLQLAEVKEGHTLLRDKLVEKVCKSMLSLVLYTHYQSVCNM